MRTSFNAFSFSFCESLPILTYKIEMDQMVSKQVIIMIYTCQITDV